MPAVLGTGINTAVFAVAYGILLRPPACPEPSRIAVVSLHTSDGNEIGVPLTRIEDWRRSVRSFEATGAYSVAELTIRGIGEPRIVKTGLVTPSFFEVLRAAPEAGRAPSTSDPDEWMVLGSGLARQLAPSGRAAELLGSYAGAGGRGFQVSAVMPQEFGFPTEDVAAWMPAAPFTRLRP